MESSEQSAWETRFDWTLTALMLGAYALAIWLSGLNRDVGQDTLWAGIVSGLYIVVLQVLPRELRERRLVGEILATAGVGAILAAVALTGADNVGYMVLLAVPIFFAAAFMGFRIGMETALLATVGFIAIHLALGVDLLDQISLIALYLLIGFTFSQARRLLVIEQTRAEKFRAASELDADRLARLDEAHSLLVNLAEVAGTSELSAEAVGETALRELAERFPVVGGQVSTDVTGDVVAEYGRPGSGGDAIRIPIEGSDRRLGTVRLWVEPGAEIDRDDPNLVATVAGVALAFDNIQLLETVAKRAVQDERSRVARELHDHIGPELASFGLSLDVLVHGRLDPRVTPQLRTMRGGVTELVERVRATVADLRRADTTTIGDRIDRIVLDRRPDQPVLEVAVEERRLTAGATAIEVGAMLAEVVRNADRHAQAATVRIEGVIDGDRGRLAVVDDGAGFDPAADYPGHFGLLGMRERAAAIGGRIEIASAPGAGTKVTIVWGDRSEEAVAT